MLKIKIMIVFLNITLAISGISLNIIQYVNNIGISEDKGRISQNDYNRIYYSDGYYYYQSSADNFYLYKADKYGKKKECLVKQVPKEIYVKDDWIYFTNASDGETLYRVGTDGSGLEQLVERKIDRLLPVEDKFCFLEKENIIRTQDNTGDSYTWRSRIDYSYVDYDLLVKKIYSWSEKEGEYLLYEGSCRWLSTDGEQLYIIGVSEKAKDGNSLTVLDLDGKVKYKNKEYAPFMCLADDCVYLLENNKIITIERENINNKNEIEITKENEAQVIVDFEVYRDNFYVLIYDYTENAKKDIILRYDHNKLSWEKIYSQNLDNNMPHILGDGFSFLNNKIFVKLMKTENKGELWYWFDIPTKKMTVFDDMEPFTGIETNADTNFVGSSKENLDEDYDFEEVVDDGMGNDICTRIKLPKINSNIPAYEKINQEIKQYAQDFYKERMKYAEYIRNVAIEWDNESRGTLYYVYTYADPKYTSIVYHKFLGASGIVDFDDYIVKMYSSVTGEEITIEDLFQEDFNNVLLRFCFAMRKTEMGMNILYQDLDLLGGYNSMTQDYGIQYYTTEKGINVFIVERVRTRIYNFIISYEELDDILVK